MLPARLLIPQQATFEPQCPLATEVQRRILLEILGVDKRPRALRRTFSPGGCSTSGHHGKKKLAFGLLNWSPVWPFLRQKLLNRFDHSLPHRKSTSALPPAADVKGCTSLSPGLTPSGSDGFWKKALLHLLLSTWTAHTYTGSSLFNLPFQGGNRCVRVRLGSVVSRPSRN